ncbi:hypothetical protein ACFLYE_00215 [Chloroflexota bacterium]
MNKMPRPHSPDAARREALLSRIERFTEMPLLVLSCCYDSPARRIVALASLAGGRGHFYRH